MRLLLAFVIVIALIAIWGVIVFAQYGVHVRWVQVQEELNGIMPQKWTYRIVPTTQIKAIMFIEKSGRKEVDMAPSDTAGNRAWIEKHTTLD